MKRELPHTYGNAFLCGELVVAMVLAIIALAMGGCATFAVSSTAKDNGVADYSSRGVTAGPASSWESFAHGAEAIARAKAEGAYVRALDASAVWYAQQDVAVDVIVEEINEHSVRLTVLELWERCKKGDTAACTKLGSTIPAARGAR